MRPLLAALSLVALLAGAGVGAEGGGHVFRSKERDESIELIGAEAVEVVLPGESAARSGRYRMLREGGSHRVEVQLGGGMKVYYRLAPGGLLSERSGKLLRLAPP